MTMCTAVHDAVSDSWLSWIKYVEGATFWEVYQELIDMHADPHFADKWYTAGRTLLKHVLKVCQPLKKVLNQETC